MINDPATLEPAILKSRLHPYEIYDERSPVREKPPTHGTFAKGNLPSPAIHVVNVVRDYVGYHTLSHGVPAGRGVWSNDASRSMVRRIRIQDAVSVVTDDTLLIVMDQLLVGSFNEKLSENLRAIAEANEFIEKLYSEKTSSKMEESVLGIVQSVFRWISSKSFTIVDFVLKSAQSSKLSTETMVALLRTTANHENDLPGWREFLQDVRDELALRSLDANRILKGL